MVKRFKGIVGIAFCLLLGGCNEAALMKRWTPPEAEAVAREYVDLLRQGKFDQIEHDLDPSLVDSSVQDTLATMAAYFPDENPTSVKVVGVNVNRSAETQYHEYHAGISVQRSVDFGQLCDSNDGGCSYNCRISREPVVRLFGES